MIQNCWNSLSNHEGRHVGKIKFTLLGFFLVVSFIYVVPAIKQYTDCGVKLIIMHVIFRI